MKYSIENFRPPTIIEGEIVKRTLDMALSKLTKPGEWYNAAVDDNTSSRTEG